MAESQGNNNAGGAVERVTIAEAAALLGCHPNTVRSRVKAGMYRAEKVHTENGPTWMIEQDSLTNKAPTSARQQAVSEVPAAQQAAIQELARAIVREAGLQHDTEREAEQKARERFVEGAREYYKARVNLSQNMATLGGATLVALTVISRTLVPDPNPEWMLVASFVLLFASTMLSSLNLYFNTFNLRQVSWGDMFADVSEVDRLRDRLFQRRPNPITRWERIRFQFRHDFHSVFPTLLYYFGLGMFLIILLEASGLPMISTPRWTPW